ncbi:MAG: hypothetical protein LBW85_06305 [Deltaproteobacteria bacterium]|jgi:uncharacterized Zn finger protein/DNA-binding transcriptional regulator YiaG|nr:hypothetical protein [Deltaproteobacteria bacterium]
MTEPVKTYVTVAQRRQAAARQLKELSTTSEVSPVLLEGAPFARTFWARLWHSHFEGHELTSKRMNKGLSCLRNNAVVHFEASERRLKALVSGVWGDMARVFTVTVELSPVPLATWQKAKDYFQSRVHTVSELLSGRLPAAAAGYLRDSETAFLPGKDAVSSVCDCGDGPFCIHAAAAMCAAAVRIDSQPRLFFLLLGVDPEELVSGLAGLPEPIPSERLTHSDLPAQLPLPLFEQSGEGAPTVVVRRRSGREAGAAAPSAAPEPDGPDRGAPEPPHFGGEVLPPYGSQVTRPYGTPAPHPFGGGPSSNSQGGGPDSPWPPSEELSDESAEDFLKPRKRRLPRASSTRRKKSVWVPVPVDGEPSAEAAAVPPEKPRSRRGGRVIPDEYQFSGLYERLRPAQAVASSDPSGAGEVSPQDEPVSGKRQARRTPARSAAGSEPKSEVSTVSTAATKPALKPAPEPVAKAAARTSRAAAAKPAQKPRATVSKAASTAKAAARPAKAAAKTARAAPKNAKAAPKNAKAAPKNVKAAPKTSRPAARTARPAAKPSKAVRTSKQPRRPMELPPLDFRRVTGNDIRALRKYTALPLEAFSYKMKICKATLIRWESTKGVLGLYTPSVEALKRLYRSLQRKARNQDYS